LLKGYGFFGETQKCPALQLVITGPVSLELGKNTANKKIPIPHILLITRRVY